MEQRRLGSRYFVDEVLGRGGMGEVFRGRDSDGNACAIEILRRELATEPRVVTRFVAERTLLTGAHDPHSSACTTSSSRTTRSRS